MDGLREKLETLLEEIQQSLFDRAKQRMEDNTHDCDNFDEYKQRVKEGGFYRIHWDGTDDSENRLQGKTKSTIRCIPLDAEEEDGACLVSGNPSERRVIASQAY